MPVEKIIEEYEKQKKIIADAQARQNELVDSLISAKDEDWDFVSIRKAAQKSGLSTTSIYRFINTGRIRCIHKGALAYVSSKELEMLDCDAADA